MRSSLETFCGKWPQVLTAFGLFTTQIEESMLGTPVKQIIKDMTPGETIAVPALDGTELIVEKAEGTTVRLRKIQCESVTADGTRVTLHVHRAI